MFTLIPVPHFVSIRLFWPAYRASYSLFLRVFTRIFFLTRFTVPLDSILNLCVIKQPVAFLENRCGERKVNETGSGSCLEFLCSTCDVECSPSVIREQRKISPLQGMAAYGGVVP
jgi:hypothetical protein